LGSFLDSRPQHGVKRMFKYVLIYLKEVVYPHAQCAGVPRKLGVQKRVGCVPFYERSDRMVCRASECLSPHSQARYAIARLQGVGMAVNSTPRLDGASPAEPIDIRWIRDPIHREHSSYTFNSSRGIQYSIRSIR
jgi:hypothetical protein